MKPIIEIKNLSKKYQIRENIKYKSFRDTIANAFTGKKKKNQGDFWALKNISFTVQPGEVLGIIGKNGAGKSTLLKILSQITPPTSGKAILRGRVASLLEVGTGFHPELTGRENIFLNGAILGMTRQEIRKKFDEIVDFAEIERFLDTPVKHYSSGMYMRLAFSVAAHLDPEILLIDEVLAVGDSQFQKKCLGKIGDSVKDGKTIILISHNMSIIKSICKKTILLEKGRIKSQGDSQKIIDQYLSTQAISFSGQQDLTKENLRKNSDKDSLFKWEKIVIKNSKNKISNTINFGEPFVIHLVAQVYENIHDQLLGFSIDTIYNVSVTNSFQTDFNLPENYKKGLIKMTVTVNPNFLNPDRYIIGLGARGPRVTDWIPNAIELIITEISNDSPKNKIVWRPYHSGIIRHPFTWSLKTK